MQTVISKEDEERAETEAIRTKLSLIAAYPHMFDKIMAIGDEEEDVVEDERIDDWLSAEEVEEGFGLLQHFHSQGFAVEDY